MQVILPIHVVAAGLGLVSGFVALSAMKGAKLHRKSGMLFVYAIVAMCVTGIVMALARGEAANAIVGVMTIYMVITALTTVRPRSATSRRWDIGFMVVAMALGVTTLVFGLQALASASGEKYGIPPVPLFIISAVGLLGGLGDFRTIRSGGLRGAPRLVRHLWRMCLALWLTVFSFFGSRTRTSAIFPEPLLIPAVRALPILLVFLAMLYWLWRVRVRRSLRGLVVVPEAA
jgi:uncharacterized membrane protein